ncbi:MAG: response regulator transcription factor [Gemmatimonadota bacterium]|nr:MAG: response regulator transcription factor [Gemmatimonadota bacterium]
MNTERRSVKQLRPRKPSIMVIDDDSDVRDSFSVILEDHCDLLLAASGEEALAQLRDRNDINMIFLDYKLPRMNGLDFLKALHQYKINVPVVMVTGRGTRDIAVKAFQYEVEDYITKPFRVRDIQNAVVKVIEKSRPHKTTLTRAKTFINKNVHKKMSTLEIANSLGAQYRDLVQQMKADTGMTIVGFKNARRIELAKKYLRENDWKLESVSTAVGFRRQNYFSYVFRKIAGLTPSAYRKQFRKYPLKT